MPQWQQLTAAAKEKAQANNNGNGNGNKIATEPGEPAKEGWQTLKEWRRTGLALVGTGDDAHHQEVQPPTAPAPPVHVYL